MPKMQTYTAETALSDNHVFITEDGSSPTSETKKTTIGLLKTYLGGTEINEWTESTVYEIGDIVINSNNLYKCTTAHTSGETFDVSNWNCISTGTLTSISWDDVLNKPFNSLGTDLSVIENVLSVAKVNGHTVETDVPTDAVFTDTTYNVFTATVNGLVPYPTTSDGKFLKDDGSWSVAQGEKGDNAYCWIKYSAIQPTQDSDMSDTPNEWLGIYSGASATAPTTYTSYSWYKTKGENGGIEINDTSTNSTTETWSVNKINSTKQDKITISSTLTLTVAGWNSETKVQKALISLNTSDVNSIIYDLSCLDTVISNAVIPSLEETDGITFKCTTIPTSDINFKVKVTVIV